MKRPAAAATVLLVAALALAGCSDRILNLYPLQVGNQWIFKTTYPDTDQEREDTELVVRRSDSTYHLSNGDTLIHYRNHGIINKNGVYILRFPLEKGYAWMDQGFSLEITSVTKTVRVPAGEFEECVEVTWHHESGGKRFVSVSTYAPGVGPVLYEYYGLADGGGKTLLLKSELKRYRLGGTDGQVRGSP